MPNVLCGPFFILICFNVHGNDCFIQSLFAELKDFILTIGARYTDRSNTENSAQVRFPSSVSAFTVK